MIDKKSSTVLDTRLEIGPNAGAREIADAVAAWDAARRDDQTLDARIKGGPIATRRKMERREEALSIARPLWALPSEEMSVAAIADRAGISVRTLYTYLGRRMPAQRSAKREDRGDE